METTTDSTGMDMGSAIQKELDPLENARLQFEEAAARLKLDPAFLQIIKEPRRVTIVKLPVHMDDGSIRLAGTPAAGTYPVSSFQVGVLEVSTSDGKSWTAYSTPVIGSIGTLSLTSVEMQTTQGNTTLYTIHGSLATSTLTQLQGTANLTMTASF